MFFLLPTDFSEGLLDGDGVFSAAGVLEETGVFAADLWAGGGVVFSEGLLEVVGGVCTAVLLEEAGTFSAGLEEVEGAV